jgi:hypothetical protein
MKSLRVLETFADFGLTALEPKKEIEAQAALVIISFSTVVTVITSNAQTVTAIRALSYCV